LSGVSWILAGIAILLALPLTVFILLIILFVHLRRNYLQYIERGFQEIPLFNIPRGQPDPHAEDVRFPTFDGLTLAGCYFKTQAPRKGVILFGLEFGSNRWSCREYCGHLIEAGYDVFAYEPRNHGDSDTEPNLEKMHWSMDRDVVDARAAIDYLKSRPDADPRGIGLFGISKGAGAGILTAADEPFIRCAVTDGMFAARTTLVPYMRHWITIYNKHYLIQGLLPSWYYAWLADLAIAKVGRERGVQFLYLEPALRRFRRPLLMIHGQHDRYILPDMAKKLFDLARPPKEFWLIPGAKHNMGLQVAPAEYRQRVRDFFDRYLANIK
jgi:pimeloyl-ACP methyl ester carboxylesterase